LKLKLVVIDKMAVVKVLLNTLKLNFPSYDWLCANGSHIYARAPF